MSSLTVYWSDELAEGPITPAIKYPMDALAMSVMTLPDFKTFQAAGVQRCPGFVSYFKNSVVYRSPIDLTVTRTSQGYAWNTSLSDQSEVDALVETRDDSGFLSIRDYAHFWCDEPLLIEQVQPTFTDTDFSLKCEVIPGTFDVSKWFRPLQPVFRMRGGVESFSIKRGDPLYVVRFLTDRKIEFKQFTQTDRLRQLHSDLMRVKRSTRTFHSSLENYYSVFAERKYRKQVLVEIKRSLVD